MIEVSIYDHDTYQQRQYVLPTVPRVGESVQLRETPKGPNVVKTVVLVAWQTETSSVTVSVTRDEERIRVAVGRP